jgi:hypothetical protein
MLAGNRAIECTFRGYAADSDLVFVPPVTVQDRGLSGRTGSRLAHNQCQFSTELAQLVATVRLEGS